MTDKLKPCPFCGGIAKQENTNRMWDGQLYVSTYIECKVCGAQTREVWNTQYDDRPNDRSVLAVAVVALVADLIRLAT